MLTSLRLVEPVWQSFHKQPAEKLLIPFHHSVAFLPGSLAREQHTVHGSAARIPRRRGADKPSTRRSIAAHPEEQTRPCAILLPEVGPGGTGVSPVNLHGQDAHATEEPSASSERLHVRGCAGRAGQHYPHGLSAIQLHLHLPKCVAFRLLNGYHIRTGNAHSLKRG
jgi:hypothetical protein